MKIVKKHRSRSAHSEPFGIWSGKTLEEVKVDPHATCATYGVLDDMIVHVKIGTGDAFLWIDDLDEARALGEKLIEIADEQAKRLASRTPNKQDAVNG